MRAARADPATALLAAPEIAPDGPPLMREPEQGWSGTRNDISLRPVGQLRVVSGEAARPCPPSLPREVQATQHNKDTTANKEEPTEHHRRSSPRPITLNCASDINATIAKISVEIAAAKPKFWPESVKAMR